jgi:hypothetical protein
MKLEEMSVLFKRDSGLPVNLWLDDSGTWKNTGHWKRIKFQSTHGNKTVSREMIHHKRRPPHHKRRGQNLLLHHHQRHLLLWQRRILVQKRVLNVTRKQKKGGTAGVTTPNFPRAASRF